MIELLIVIGVIGIAAAFAVPQIRGSMTAYRLTASANLVAGELDAARVMAISRGAIYEVRFSDRAVSVVDLEDGGANARSPKNFEPGVRMTSGAPIRFFPRGYAQSGRVTLANENGTTIGIEVLASGKIRVKDVSSGG